MRKIFSLFAAVLFAGSMMAIDFTLSGAAPVTKEGVTVTFSQGAGSNAPAWYDNGLRLYANNEVTVSGESNITGITFNWQKQGQKAFNTATASTGEYTHPSAAGEGVWTGSATSVTFTLGATGQLLLNTFSVTVGGEPQPTVNYYVVGNMTGWEVNEAYKLAANPKVAGEFKGNFTFADFDEFKVVGFDGETKTWYPDGTDNNFQISEQGGDYTVYFRPAGGVEGWYYGFFSVVEKTEPILPQYDVAEAIAAGLAENEEILVRGVITKMQIKGKNFAKYGSVNIFVADATGAAGEFEFYNCYSLDSATFVTTSPVYDETGTTTIDLKKVADGDGNQIRLGDTIVAFGKYKLYNTTHELNTGCYLKSIQSAPVPPAQTIDVNMSEGLYFTDCVASDGWWQIYGADEKFDISISNVETTQAEGTYTMADLDPEYTYVGVINGTDTSYVYFEDGSVTLSIAANGDVTVAGQLTGDDDNIYNINLHFVAPSAQETVDVVIPDGELYDEYADYGLYAVYGTDDNDVYVQLSIWAEGGFEGQFSEQDLDYSYVGTMIMEGEEEQAIYSATITVTPGNGGDYAIAASILCYNNKLYKVSMTIPGEEQGVEEVLDSKKAIKSIINGQLVIEKAGKQYTVSGAEIR